MYRYKVPWCRVKSVPIRTGCKCKQIYVYLFFFFSSQRFARVVPLKFATTHVFTCGERLRELSVLPKNTTKLRRAGLNCRPPVSEAVQKNRLSKIQTFHVIYANFLKQVSCLSWQDKLWLLLLFFPRVIFVICLEASSLVLAMALH